MIERINLNDGWQVTWTDYVGRGERPDRPHAPPPMAATVPGSVHQDLLREGLIPDPFAAFGTDHCLWVEGKDWWYTRSFDTPEQWRSGPRTMGAPVPADSPRRAVLVFHGLDTFATVWLNGRLLGWTANMFLRHEFDVTDALAAEGPNELIVRLASTAHSIRVDPDHAPLDWSPERLFVRKPAMSFGWDIAPRLVTVGIWRPVELVLIDGARLVDVQVAPQSVQAERATGTIRVELDWFGPAAETVFLQGRITPADGSGPVVTWDFRAELRPGRNAFTQPFAIDRPRLWWPVGYGEQPLYDASVIVSSLADGRPLDARTVRTGFRTIELVQRPQPSGARSFFFRCNGRDLFVTGLNWTPLDAIFPRVTPQRTTATLESLAAIGCNMLRVWGGAFYEGPHFYAECDRLGIMIWQDFMMACGWYPQTDAMAAAMQAEAEQVVRDLRNHPCIALWAGDNENDAFYPALMKANRLTREVLSAVAARLDSKTVYLPSSPYSPASPDPQSQTEGDVHWYGHGKNYRTCEGWDIRCRFMSEFGHLSLPSMEVVEKYFPPEDRWPLTNLLWRHHGADTTRVPRFRGTERVLAALAACGKPAPANIAEAVAASQELQAEAVCAWIEHWSEDPEFGGFLLWNVADCWPQMSDAVIDYLGNPKAVFNRLGSLFARLREEHKTIVLAT